jgi:YrhK-like protein
VSSVAFFSPELFELGVVLFVIGSAELGIRPVIRLTRRGQLQGVSRGMPHEIARDF